MKKAINWKLLAACVVTTFMVLPYTIALSPIAAKILTPVVIVAQVIQSTILFAIAIFFGTKLAKITGFEMLVWEGKKPVSYLKNDWRLSVGMGVLAGILIIILSFLFSGLSLTFLTAEAGVEIWKRFFASFYGGIAEEVLFRLFLMTLLAWIISKISKTKKGLPTAGGIWGANILVAILFGLGHLGITGTITSISAVVILRAILLNGVAGVIFGWLYWKKGLESAMIAHFSADILIHVITPAIAGLFV